MSHTNVRTVSLFGKQVRENTLLGVVFGVYLVIKMLSLAVHEPWFDEYEAWNMSKNLSIWEFLSEYSHYEGHPPLWHFLLMPFAKLGLPAEWCLKSVTFVFTGIATALILFVSPMPFWMRVTLPFTYFLFYQYGTLSRPYCMMYLGFVLAALFYRTRDEKPFQYILALMLICASSVYGMFFAFGICLLWVIHIFRMEIKAGNGRSMWMSARARALYFLVIACALLGLSCYPTSESQSLTTSGSLFKKLVYMFIIAPVDATCYDTVLRYDYLRNFEVFDASFIPGVLMFVIVFGIGFMAAYRKRKLLELVVPYTCFALVCVFAYMNTHHIGLAMLFFVYWFWTWCYPTKEEQRPLPAWIVNAMGQVELIKKKGWDAEWVAKKVGQFACGIICGVSLWWTVSSVAMDVTQPYGYGRGLYHFLKEHNCLELTYYGEWSGENTAIVAGTDFLLYMDGNPVLNLNCGDPHLPFMIHRDETMKEREETLAAWREMGPPDILLGVTGIEQVFSSEELPEYVPVYLSEGIMIWKGSDLSASSVPVYIREDLLEAHDLQEIELE